MGEPVYGLHAPPLRWRSYHDAWVVFHDASGSTHLLDPVSGAVLRALEGGPAPHAKLLAVAGAAVGAGAPSGAAAELGARVARALEEFERLGLVERAP